MAWTDYPVVTSYDAEDPETPLLQPRDKTKAISEIMCSVFHNQSLFEILPFMHGIAL